MKEKQFSKTNTFYVNTLGFKESFAEDMSWFLSEKAMDTPVQPIPGSLQRLLLSTSATSFYFFSD